MGYTGKGPFVSRCGPTTLRFCGGRLRPSGAQHLPYFIAITCSTN
jgi:hypothetical protein